MIILDYHSIAERGSAHQGLKRLHIRETDVPKWNCQPYFHRIYSQKYIQRRLFSAGEKAETTTCCDHEDANVHDSQLWLNFCNSTLFDLDRKIFDSRASDIWSEDDEAPEEEQRRRWWISYLIVMLTAAFFTSTSA